MLQEKNKGKKKKFHSFNSIQFVLNGSCVPITRYWRLRWIKWSCSALHPPLPRARPLLRFHLSGCSVSSHLSFSSAGKAVAPTVAPTIAVSLKQQHTGLGGVGEGYSSQWQTLCTCSNDQKTLLRFSFIFLLRLLTRDSVPPLYLSCFWN